MHGLLYKNALDLNTRAESAVFILRFSVCASTRCAYTSAYTVNEEMDGLLSLEEVEKFHKDGYLIIDQFLTDSECNTLIDTCNRIIRDADFSQHPKVTFETTENKQASEDYFITSGDKVRFFFEEGVVTADGQLNCPKEKSLNKIGHALHNLVPEFKKATFSDKIKGIAKSLELKKPAVVQSMYIFKQPKIGGTVVPHRDSSFLYTDPMKLYGIWIALEDAFIDNGCLWFIPGSHRQRTSLRMVRKETENGVTTVFEGQAPQNKPEEFIVTPVKKGGLVLIHGDVVHKSEQNQSDRSRNIYTFHLFDTASATWSPQNWLQPVEPFKLLY